MSEQEAEQFWQEVAQLYLSGQSRAKIEEALVSAGSEPADASKVFEEIDNTFQQYRNGNKGYWQWLKFIARCPRRSGFFGILLISVTVLITLPAIFLGVMLFPAGTYPRIVLAAPGLLIGLIVFFMSSLCLFAALRIICLLYGPR